MSAVWVVRDVDGEMLSVFTNEIEANANAPYAAPPITRETLLTPAQAAVIEAAKDYCGASTRYGAFQLTDAERARPKLCAAVAFLRAQEGA